MIPLPDSAWSKVKVSATGCWEWQGTKINTTGRGRYGRIYVRHADGRQGRVPAHRVFYEHQHGPIPEGLVIDHVCRNTICVNPEHLRAVTNRENTLCGDTLPARQANSDVCPNGHVYAEVGVVRWKKGTRNCAACLKARRARQLRRAA